ncbi:MAG: flagellar basal body-associated FliL family protein [Pseudomonadota bacterium]
MADKKPQDDDTPEKKGPGLMSVLPLAVIAGGATFGMVWFAATPPPMPEPVMMAQGEDGEMVRCPAQEEPDPVSIEELEARDAKYVRLEPITVSLGADAGAKHLKVSIVLGTPSDSLDLTDVQFLRLRDRFLERLRTVDSALLRDPKAMPALKLSLLAQAKETLGQDSVYSVLITDFLMK